MATTVIPKGYAPASSGGQTILYPTAATKNVTPSGYAPASLGGRTVYVGKTANYGSTGGGQKTGGGSTSSGGGTQQSQPSYNLPQAPEGPTQEDYNALIDQSYNEQMNYLNQVAQRLTPDYQSALAEAESAYKTQAAGLGTQKESARGTLAETQTKGQESYESAIAQARQLYDQLSRGYQQRFGGASSAGQAATEIANTERMRQQGQNWRSLQDVTRQVNRGYADIENQFNQNMLQLEQNKIAAQNQAKRDFNDKLNQIEAQKAQLGSAKAQAKLQALQTLRAQVLQIEAENRQFQNTLALQKEQNKMALDLYVKQLAATQSGVSTGTASSMSSLNTQPTSNLQATSTTSTPSTTTAGGPYYGSYYGLYQPSAYKTSDFYNTIMNPLGTTNG